jgi:aspartate 1-decarboxylase
MILTLLKSKIHRASITKTDLHYEGSISIDRHLMDAAHFLPNEQVDIYNITNGQRFTTYVIEAPRHSGDMIINGAAARLVAPQDLIIVCAYCQLNEQEALSHIPIVISVNAQNKMITHD